MKQLTGIIVPIVTPFDQRGRIEEGALREQLDFMIEKGVHGVCAGGTTGEGHTLSLDELRRIVEITVDQVAGRIPVLAGILANSTFDLLARANALSDLELDALQVTPTYYLYNPNDDEMVNHFHALAEVDSTPLIVYNVVRWNMLGANLLVRLMSEVPTIIGVKQSGGEIKLLADLLMRAPAGKLIYSAQDALLYPTFALGAHGAIAASPTAAPSGALALWEAVKTGNHESALALHKRILRLWNAVTGNNCPAAVKYALALQKCPSGYPRRPMHEPGAEQKREIEAALKGVLELTESLSATAA